jgi:chemotaxis protein MotB
MMRENNWHIMVEGHSEEGETFSSDPKSDAYSLSSLRAMAVSKVLIKRGVDPKRITTLFYGDSRPQEKINSSINDRRVEFLIKKSDLRADGRKVESK